MKKIGVLLFLVAILAIGFSGCGKEDKVVLNVYNWGDYIDESILDDFEKEYNIKVNYELYATNEDMYVKIKQGGTQYDVLFPSDYMIEKMINEDMLEEINLDELENYKYIDDKFKNLEFDKENKYSVPYLWGTVGILYNRDIVSDEEVKSWDVMFDEKYKGQILMYDSQRDALAVALKKLGYSLNTRNIKELEEAKQLLVDQKSLVLAYVGDNVRDMMLSEEGALALVWSGDAYIVLLEGGQDKFGYHIPEEGSNMWFDSMVIPKGSEHKAEAQLFIDYMTRPEVALKNVEYVQYSTPNTETMNMLSDELKNLPYAYPKDGELDDLEVFKDPGDFIEEYNRVWVEIKAN